MNRIRYSNSSRKPIYEDYPPTQAPHLNTEVYNDRGYAQNIVNSQSEYYRGLSHSLQSQERKLFDYQADYPRSDVCYVCGKMGHWAKNCPDNENAVQRGNVRGGYRGRGRGGKNGAFNTRGKEDKCYKCGKPGHFARECHFDGNKAATGQGYITNSYVRRGDYCYRCGQPGHMARDCVSDTNACYNCHQEGHLARDCPQESECYRCGEPGHLARDCSLQDETDQRWSRKVQKECYICKSTEHIQAQCPEAQCYRCQKEGHIARDCPLQDLYNPEILQRPKHEKKWEDNKSSLSCDEDQSLDGLTQDEDLSDVSSVGSFEREPSKRASDDVTSSSDDESVSKGVSRMRLRDRDSSSDDEE